MTRRVPASLLLAGILLPESRAWASYPGACTVEAPEGVKVTLHGTVWERRCAGFTVEVGGRVVQSVDPTGVGPGVLIVSADGATVVYLSDPLLPRVLSQEAMVLWKEGRRVPRWSVADIESRPEMGGGLFWARRRPTFMDASPMRICTVGLRCVEMDTSTGALAGADAPEWTAADRILQGEIDCGRRGCTFYPKESLKGEIPMDGGAIAVDLDTFRSIEPLVFGIGFDLWWALRTRGVYENIVAIGFRDGRPLWCEDGFSRLLPGEKALPEP